MQSAEDGAGDGFYSAGGDREPYYSLNIFLRQKFGGKVYRIALNPGFTCPNRDGTIGTGGCTFCLAGSGTFAGNPRRTIDEQITEGMRGLAQFRPKAYIAYFQAFTGTYAPLPVLRDRYRQAFARPEIAAVSIATRPDCVPEDVLDLLDEIHGTKPVWIELGLQTAREETAVRIRRGYALPCFEDAVRRIRRHGFDVIVHVILGLPGETREDMLHTVRYAGRMDIQGIKLQLLHVLQGTELSDEYRRGAFRVLTREEYVDLVCTSIGLLPRNIVIHRMTGDGPSQELIAPQWSTAKRTVLNEIHHALKVREITQGCMRGDEKHERGITDADQTDDSIHAEQSEFSALG